jgi:spore maturation protein CgeB
MSGTVLIIGTERESSLEMSYQRAFQKLHWTVHRWDPQIALRKSVRFGKAGLMLAQLTNVTPWLHKANLELLGMAYDLKPDLILTIATSGINAGTLAQLHVVIPDTRIYSIFPDTPHNLVTNQIECLPLFDRVIVYSSALVDVFKRFGARYVMPLGFAADPDLHHPYIGANKHDLCYADVSFIGNWRPEREAFLEQLTEFNLVIWGSDYWKKRTRPQSPLKKLWAGYAAEGAEFSRAVSVSKISLNILGPISWPGPNMRSFELPACQAFVLSERQPGITQYFKEGQSIECYSTIEEAREKINYYLREDAARKEIAQAGYKTVIHCGNTYVDRAKTIIDWLQQDNGNA